MTPGAHHKPKRKGDSKAEEMPLYRVLFESLRNEILRGQYAASGALPSESQVEERFGVSRITVRRAIEELERAGLVERSKGRSTRVLSPSPDAIVDVTQELARQMARGIDMQPRVLEFEWVKPTPELAQFLEVPIEEDVLWVTRVRSRRSKPVLHTAAYLPARVGRGIARRTLNREQLLNVLRNNGHVIGSADETFSAAPCSPELSKVLDLAPGAPLFFIRRLIRDVQDRPLVLLCNSFRWDCFSYRILLQPTKQGMQTKAEPEEERSDELMSAM